MSHEPDLPPGISAQVRERFARLSPEEQARVLARFAEARARRAGSARIPRYGRSRVPLTAAQQRVWFLQQLEADSPAFNQSHVWGLHGCLDVAALQRSLSEIVRRHEILRTRYVVVDDEPVQEVMPAVPFALEMFDARGAGGERADALSAFRRRIASAPFDLASAPLLRAGLATVASYHHHLVITRHHIASDRWSAGVFLRELATLYDAFARGAASPLPELPIQYTDYAIWARERAATPSAEAALSGIARRLAGAFEPLTLVPSPHAGASASSSRGGRVLGSLPPDVVHGLRELARTHNATLFMALLAVFSVLVSRYTGRAVFTIGTPIAGRVHPDTEPLIGLFANMLALRADLGGDPPFIDLLARVRTEAVRAFEQQHVPFERVLEAVRPGRAKSIAPLTPLIFALQNVDYEGLRLRDVDVELIDSPLEDFAGELALLSWEEEGRLVLRADYRADRLEAAFVRRMIGHFGVLAAAVVTTPSARLSQLDLLTSHEREQLLVQFNATAATYPAGRRIEELFEEQVALRPDAVAVVDGDRQLSYQELNIRADQIARRLRKLGVGPRDRVALLLHGTWEFIAAVFGTYKAGAAYVAIDPQHPPVRRDLLLQDAQPAAAIVTSPPGPPPTLSCQIVVLEEWFSSAEPPRVEAAERGTSEDVACVLYTSGSTGAPKGVLMPHRAVVNHSWWMAQTYGAGTAERVLQASPCSFDASMWEITMPLITGGAVVIGSPLGRIDPPAFLRAIRDGGITSLLLVPAQIPFLLERPEIDHCVSLRHLFVGGEVFPAKSAAQLAARIPARVHNIYGPTEACVNSTMQQWEPSMGDSGIVPIGRPIGNTQVYVLDAHNQPAPIGIPGELCIAGEGVSHGYLNAPELTARRFVAHPFAAGRTMYRTGDRARWREDGSLEFLGRLDDQFKLRGIRIEPGEIEAALVAHPEVHAAAVVVRGDDPESAHLVAFLVPPPNATMRPDAATLRAFLRERLPEVMVPATYRWLDALPLTAHGKVAHTALPDVPAERAAPPASAAERDTERRLMAIWAEILQQPSIDLDSHFFDAGGHSLLAVRLFARIEQEFGTRLRISKLFEAPTVRLLARAIDSAAEPAATPLVAIRSGGTRPPLYIVHGIGGEVLGFEALARHLPAEQPVFGFEAPIPGSTDSPGVVESARTYVDLLVRTQPRGPYLLSGYSWGGPLAFEMACHLAAAGREVGLLLLIDAGLPGATRRTLQRRPLPLSAYVRHAAYWLVDDLFASPPSALGARIRSRLRVTAAKAARRMRGHESDAARPDVRDRLGMWKFPEEYRPALEKRWQAFESHAPGHFAGRIVVVRSRTGPLMRPLRPVSGWETLADAVEYHLVAGSHANILAEPRVRQLAAIVAQAIERATTRPSVNGP